MAVEYTKISKVESLLRSGKRFTPAHVWTRYGIQANTLHRCFNQLKKMGYKIGRKEYRTKNGKFSSYWCESAPCK